MKLNFAKVFVVDQQLNLVVGFCMKNKNVASNGNCRKCTLVVLMIEKNCILFFYLHLQMSPL